MNTSMCRPNHAAHSQLSTYVSHRDGGWWAGADTGTIVRNGSGYMQVNTVLQAAFQKAIGDGR